jgi:hypothetical protein
MKLPLHHLSKFMRKAHNNGHAHIGNAQVTATSQLRQNKSHNDQTTNKKIKDQATNPRALLESAPSSGSSATCVMALQPKLTIPGFLSSLELSVKLEALLPSE